MEARWAAKFSVGHGGRGGSRSHLGLVALAAALTIFFGIGGNDALASTCPNEAFRTGFSAALPSCRAYELVTPEATGGSLFGLQASTSNAAQVFPVELASPIRDSMLFMTQGEPMSGTPEPSGTYDQYESVRTAEGWRVVRRLTPNGAQAVFPGAGGVDQGHSYTFTTVLKVAGTKPGGSLAEGGGAVYLGNPDGSFELLGTGSLGSDRLARGRYISVGGNHIIFNTGTENCNEYGEPCTVPQLEPSAAPAGTPAIYDRAPNGPTRVVSLLPGNITPAAGEAAEYQGVSADGSVVAFMIEGVLYVRIDNSSTVEVTGPGATFAGLNEDGSAIFYLEGGNVFRFDIPSGSTEQVNADGAELLSEPEIVNISADGSHVFFISNSQLGSRGAAGEPNLYVWSSGGGIDFIATVSFEDVSGEPALNNWTTAVVSPDTRSGHGPGANSSQTTPDGSVLAFESRAQLTAYANEGFREIYRWDESTGSIQCASCDPDGDAPTSDARFRELVVSVPPAVVIHNLSADGGKVFFETSESLVTRDLDGGNDIYEWQATSAIGEPSVGLISSGQTEQTFRPVNRILGITPSGGDVIFGSLDQLLPTAPVNGVPVLYDARVGGGFPDPLPGGCIGDGCRTGTDMPALGQPATSTFVGKGNVLPHKRRCHRRLHRTHGKQSKKRKILCHRHKKGGAR